MLDGLNRKIDYMRVSITDRCNLRCIYCMPEDLPDIPHGDILHYEEILRFCGIMARLGIRTIKVTGGEPLVRKGCVDFLRRLKAVPGIDNVTLTTNGVLFPKYAEELKELGVDGVNFSMDAIDEKTFRRLTGSLEFDKVMLSLEKAVELGMRVKINCVPVRGYNDDGIIPLVRLAEKYPVDIRFIELMPKGHANDFEKIPNEEILDMLKKEYTDLEKDGKLRGFGPAKYYTSGVLKGGIGFISAISDHFCAECNRVRLTGDGFLKLCLYHEDGTDIRTLLRSGANDGQIEQIVADAISKKPEKHLFGAEGAPVSNVGMSKIGG